MIVLVRHGRTDANARGLLLGRSDPALDGEGIRQAGRVARALDGLDVARVVSSPLARCQATAEAIVRRLGARTAGAPARPVAVPGDAPAEPAPIELQVDPRWIELDYGALDGVPLAEVPAASWARWRSDLTWAPEGGESLHELGARVREACAEIAGVAAERDVVVVSHVSPIKAAVAWALGVGDDIAWRLWLAPGSITRIGLSGGVPSLRSFNEVAHLG